MSLDGASIDNHGVLDCTVDEGRNFTLWMNHDATIINHASSFVTKDGAGELHFTTGAAGQATHFTLLPYSEMTVAGGNVVVHTTFNQESRVVLTSDPGAGSIISLALRGKSVSRGYYQIEANNILFLGGAEHKFLGTQVVGGGHVTMSDALAVLTIGGTVSFGANLGQYDGKLTGDGELRITNLGSMSWAGGEWSARQITNTGIVTISSSTAHIWVDTLLVNQGTVDWIGADITAQPTAARVIIKNEEGATFRINEGNLTSGGAAVMTFENRGLFEKVLGTGKNSLDLQYDAPAVGKGVLRQNGGEIKWERGVKNKGQYSLQGGKVETGAGYTILNDVGGVFTGGNATVKTDRFVNAGTLWVNEDAYFGETGAYPLTLTVIGDFETSGTVVLEWRTTDTVDRINVSGQGSRTTCPEFPVALGAGSCHPSPL